MNLKEELQKELKAAMRSGNLVRKNTIRMALSNIKLMEIDKGPLDEVALTAILQKEIKMRREAIADAQKAGRKDLIESNEEEIEVLETFLPEQLSNDDLEKMVNAAISEVGATSIKEMGAVMKILLPRVAGQAPNSLISTMVREKLNQ